MKRFGSTELGQDTVQSGMVNPEPSSKPGFRAKLGVFSPMHDVVVVGWHVVPL
jgi:hypothetical protein